MSTDLLEHFNDIEVKDWDLYHHNIGLKVTPKYKTGFVVRTGNFTYDMYDSVGVKVSTMTVIKDRLQDIVLIPSKGLVLIISTNSSLALWDFDVFDAKTGEKRFTITENTYDGSATQGSSFDVLENGEIFIFNRGNRIVRVINPNGTIKQTVDFSAVLNLNSLHRLAVNSKLKVVAVTNAINSVTTIYDIPSLSSKVARITVSNTSGYVKGFTQKGNLVDGVVSSTDLIRVHKNDFANNASLGYSQTTIQKSGYTTTYLRSIKDKIYFSRSINTGSIRELLTMNEADGTFVASSLPAITTIHDIDDKYVYASDASNYRVYKRDDLSLLLTIPSAYGTKSVKSNKGNYENFSKYW